MITHLNFGSFHCQFWKVSVSHFNLFLLASQQKFSNGRNSQLAGKISAVEARNSISYFTAADRRTPIVHQRVHDCENELRFDPKFYNHPKATVKVTRTHVLVAIAACAKSLCRIHKSPPV